MFGLPSWSPPEPADPPSAKGPKRTMIFGGSQQPRAAPDPVLDSLYEQVWANPGDDAPRHVLADCLCERGDPRGEFIQIQLTEPDGPTGLAKGRAKQLERLFPTWLPPGVDVKTAVFRRGLLEECSWTGPTDFAHREWRTVRCLDCAQAPEVITGQLFTDSQLPALRELRGVPAHVFNALDDGRTRGRLEVLQTLGVATYLFDLRGEAIMRLPAVHTLDLDHTMVDVAGLRVLCALLARRNTLSHLRTPVRRLCIDLRHENPALREALQIVTGMVPGLTLHLYPRTRTDPWLALGGDGVRVCRLADRGDASVRFHLLAVARRAGLSPRYVILERTDRED